MVLSKYFEESKNLAQKVEKRKPRKGRHGRDHAAEI
jgi:hypothetical protein